MRLGRTGTIFTFVFLLAYFHGWTRIQIDTLTRIPNPIATWYYAEHVSTDSDSDLDPFPIVFVQYRNPSPGPSPNLNPSLAIAISHKLFYWKLP